MVDHFYEKVLADQTINHLFQQTVIKKQSRHQTLFISWVTGGPNQYSGQSIAKAHEGMNLQEEHFAAVATHLTSSLAEFGVKEEQIAQVTSKLISMKDEMLHH